MPGVASRVWTNGRKWLGNIVPTLFMLPLVAWGVWWMLQNDTILGLGLWLVVGGVILGWIGLNLFGLPGNAFMRRELKRELTAKNVDFSNPHYFVGFASPRFVNMLDAHEDIGFLFLHPESIEFIGEKHRMKVPRNEVQRVRFRPNVHTWVGLGRWISIDCLRDGRRYRLNVESRERNFLMLNLFASAPMRQAILDWLRKPVS
jgi:hypothetical protein